ncbi:SDR family NAD(P)-dependent oxidoreductase [Rubrivivax rivuli]|uniref:SDR family NAD(P)-dependent oxidoreductase n=1 Tax=Rubrivivax rivuli TaxID=1862385 RepID=UPI00217549FD|nr:SDR family NAD(P)-dependent oxidoreductase [Rubrivivax rivuli]
MKHVVVTGAGAGIGRCVAETLAGQGHRVWACARQPADLAALGAIAGIEPVALDVRQPAQVQALAERLPVLHGLVNNAGVGGLGWLHTFSDDEFQDILDTNLLGPQRLSRALLPALLAAGAGQGRIVHIGSMGGSITSPLYGPYTASKHALEALAQCQRLELAPHGVSVSIVQPGAVATGIGQRGAAGLRARLQRAGPPFAEAAAALLAQLDGDGGAPAPFGPSQPESASNRRQSPPAAVAAAVLHALFDGAPRARYLVGSRWEGDRVVHQLIERLLDANEGEAMQMGRDELVARLDAALAQRAAAGADAKAGRPC